MKGKKMKNSKRIIGIVVLLIVVLLIVGFYLMPGGFGGKNAITRWVSIAYVAGPSAVMEDSEASGYIHQPLTIMPSEISFLGKTCSNVTFSAKKMSAENYLAETWKITPSILKIDNQDVEAVSTNCDLQGFGEYIRLADGSLIVSIDGVFFTFSPEK